MLLRGHCGHRALGGLWSGGERELDLALLGGARMPSEPDFRCTGVRGRDAGGEDASGRRWTWPISGFVAFRTIFVPAAPPSAPVGTPCCKSMNFIIFAVGTCRRHREEADCRTGLQGVCRPWPGVWGKGQPQPAGCRRPALESAPDARTRPRRPEGAGPASSAGTTAGRGAGAPDAWSKHHLFFFWLCLFHFGQRRIVRRTEENMVP